MVLRPYPSVCYKSVVLAIGCTPSREAKRLRRRYLAGEIEVDFDARIALVEELELMTHSPIDSSVWPILTVYFLGRSSFQWSLRYICRA
ncbi:hypothetical protein KIN20_002911 [Parelaphostrongylus tenuis]|uniref:Uncharacterized protein n=1 Tax=Parelaphostrongylus tenuis TaxID=148309 RepID=A0AAD5MHH5_PARTN|nr:hypothetical protein KIN20_002911 [Parelaphostrongylus tenuis]